MDRKIVVEVKNLTKSYNKNYVIKSVSFNVFENDIFVILGPNGAGKTTTVKIIAGLIEADRGDVYIFSKKISVFNHEIKKFIGYLPDEPYIYNKLTGKEFIEFIFSIYTLKLNLEKYYFLLKEFDLESSINMPIENYSKGMKQKLLLISIFLRDPDLYIFDEPLIGLDPQSINFFKNYVIKLVNRQNKTIIISTHILDLAQQIATRIAIIDKGEILAYGTKYDIANKYGIVYNNNLEEIYLKVIERN